MNNNAFDITILVPFLNEEENLKRLETEINDFFAREASLNLELILINDGSQDNSVDVIKNCKFPKNSRLISLSQNYGSHAALRAGILHAKGQYITFVYADLQDSIENVIALYKKAVLGNEIVWAFRRDTKNSFFERIFSDFYSFLMRKYVNKRYPSKGFDVVMFSRKIAQYLNNNIEANSSIFLQILNIGFNHEFIEYKKEKRKAGKSKWTFSKKFKLLIDSFVAFSFAPIRLVSINGIICFVLGLVWSTYLVGRKLILDDLASGWPGLYSTLLLGFGITNISLGIIAEYLWRTLDAARKRPVFIIDDIIELNKE
jgi:dolichol-phosphate mannosyltransferase